ncbi:MAG: hypothetical protein U5L05_04190 [Rubrivivax sp.]|nr:hypothetical protein [Rubrivivax sp.]
MLSHAPGRGLSLAALIAVLGLLLAFQFVVRSGVERSDLWRKSVAEHATATWRCKLEKNSQRRLACLAALGRAP